MLTSICQHWLVAPDLEAPQVSAALSALEESANTVGKAWSGSWFGYHSRVYYQGLRPPPPGAHSSSEWGFDEAFGMGTRGNWEEFDFDAVKSEVIRRAGNPDLGEPKRDILLFQLVG